MGVAKEHLEWFAGLKPGDEMAVRLLGRWHSEPWRREVVTRSTGATVWWSGYSATARGRTYEIRPVTDEDRAMWQAAADDARIRRWLALRIERPGLVDRPFDPKVRTALLAAIAAVEAE